MVKKVLIGGGVLVVGILFIKFILPKMAEVKSFTKEIDTDIDFGTDPTKRDGRSNLTHSEINRGDNYNRNNSPRRRAISKYKQ